jgi:photosystem II stability/assembly factor-like uncharacterized protein
VWLQSSCVIPLSTAPNGSGSDGGTPPNTVEAGNIADVAIPTGKWANITNNLAGIMSGCGSLALMSVKPDEDLLIASVFGVGLYASSDGGSSWHELGTDMTSTMITSGLTWIEYDPQNHSQFWECGSHGSGPCATSDNGSSFTELSVMISNNDMISVDFSDPDRKTLLVGSHEQAQALYRSTDKGVTWTNIGATLPAKSFCTLPLLMDPQTYLVGCNGVNAGGPSGVYRTTDGGANWSSVSTGGGGVPPLRASDGSIYWPSPAGQGMVRSTDKGVTWTTIVGPDVISLSNYAPAELPDGRIAVLGKDYVLLSSDKGATWIPVSSELPMTNGEDLHGLVYSPFRKAFYVWHNLCSFTGQIDVLPDAVMKYDFDYQAK